MINQGLAKSDIPFAQSYLLCPNLPYFTWDTYLPKNRTSFMDVPLGEIPCSYCWKKCNICIRFLFCYLATCNYLMNAQPRLLIFDFFPSFCSEYVLKIHIWINPYKLQILKDKKLQKLNKDQKVTKSEQYFLVVWPF